MNVLYLSYDGLTDGLGRSQVLPYIFGLEKSGHHFSIISFEKKEPFKRDGANIQRLVDDAGVRWIPLAYTSSPPIVSTVYDVYQLTKTVEKIYSENPFDIIHCRSYITSLIGLRMKQKYGVKFVFDMRAFYADERVDGGLWNLKNPIFKTVYDFFKRKEIAFLSNADYSISLTEKGKEIIHSWNTIPHQPVPVQVIPCCADLDHFHPSKIDEALQSQLKLKFDLKNDDFVITYLGSIGTWYLLDEMLDFFKVLNDKRPTAKFLFITTDSPDSILPKAESKGIPVDRILISPAKREEVPTFLSLANAAIFFIQPVFSKSGSSPTKHGEMLGMGLPVIANSGVGDVDRIIEDTNSGILVREFTDEAYEKAIEQIDDLLKIPVSMLQDAAQKYYSLEEGVKKYNFVYESISSSNDDTSRS
ncbi:MAG: glycosyltransferase [Flavobacteriales bacterium]|nr:glycosyltransferase [Flavobacteriales bacterium]